jgi:hypothetical protein
MEVTRLEAVVQNQLAGRLLDFQIRLCDAGLVLEGHAYTYYIKQLAQQAVMEGIDLPIVANDIVVS